MACQTWHAMTTQEVANIVYEINIAGPESYYNKYPENYYKFYQ